MKISPDPTSSSKPGGPIQYTGFPLGSVCLIVGSAQCRVPKRVISMPCSASMGKSGTLTLRIVSEGKELVNDFLTRALATSAPVK